ncbi:MAG: response regulator [Planctomycetales bacterium]|nr:response regulator [Planctomycetales bacterium]
MTEHLVLLVDNDPHALCCYERSLSQRFRVETALGSEQAIDAVNSRGPYAVVVSNMIMPRVDGVPLLQKIIARSPDSVQILLADRVDPQAAVDVVNLGGAFRFLRSPCTAQEVGDAVEAGIRDYVGRGGDQGLMADTVNGVVRLLCDVLGLANPAAFGRGSRLKRLVSELAAAAELPDAWQCEMAAMLSQIAFVASPQLPGLGGGEADPFALAARWIDEVPGLHDVAEIVRRQQGPVEGDASAPLPARLLRLARHYDELLEDECTPALALARLAYDGDHDAGCLELLASIVHREPVFQPRQCPASDLPLGSLLAADVLALNGRLLVKAGQEITPSLKIHLQQHASRGCVPALLHALVPVEQGAAVAVTTELSRGDTALAAPRQEPVGWDTRAAPRGAADRPA